MNRALLVIDIQESFHQDPLWQAISNPSIAEDANRLVEANRAAGDLVIWILHSEPGTDWVFYTAADHGYPYALRYVAEHAEIQTAQGVTVRADTDWPDLGADDLVLVPGWQPPVPGPYVPFTADSLRRLAGHHARGGQVASVCSGAKALAEAGLLDGRRCTTHHEVQEGLAIRYPRANVVRDVVYMVDGRVATSAGIASGIDLALHLVAARHGPAAAAQVARWPGGQVARSMVVYARRNGGEQQASAMLRYRWHMSDVAHRAQDHIESRFTDPLPLSDLAAACSVSERPLTRRFTEATGLIPLRYQQILRLERAEHLIGHGATAEAAARAVGFQDARMLRRLRARPAPVAVRRPVPAGR
jgi:transcriptional regulator GlxA family with amidase domain